MDLHGTMIFSAFLAGFLGGLLPFMALVWMNGPRPEGPPPITDNDWLDEEALVFFGVEEEDHA